ncbi:putative mfs-multidrug-resistance transporter [Serendipita vermifera]|nr:putative mfs-multidrug-resistance transporter [Serendipita vermifera]
MSSSPRPSAEHQDQSTVANSRNDSPKEKHAFPATRVESLDLEAATLNNAEYDEKKKQSSISNSRSASHNDRPSVLTEATRQNRRDSAMSEAWPAAELAADPILQQEAIAEEKDPYLVTFDENDPLDPKSWSTSYRWYLTFASSLLVLNASFASSAPSGLLRTLMREFHLSQIEGTLSISLFIAGYCVGPFVWAPTSESVGRRPMFIIGFIGYFIFQIACAVAPNGLALLLFRFFGGCFAACPLTNSGAVLGAPLNKSKNENNWDANRRGTATAIFTVSPFAGPALGPIVGGYIELAGVKWQWLFWILSIFSGLCLLLIIFTIPETYGPVILAQKARKLRESTNDPRWKAPIELEEVSWRKKLSRILGRPWKIFFVEGMLVIITLYMSFIYGLLYLLFLAYPVVFVGGHHLNAGESGLTFLPIFIGGIIGDILYVFVFAPKYAKVSEQYGGKAPPEARLPMAKWGGPILAISMFWFGWTSYTSISLWAPVMAGLGVGLSLIMLFLSLFNYIIDAYILVAASALASSTVVRSAFGAGFPLFGSQMYEKLDPRIASTVLAACVVLLCPVPFIFEKYGPRIRKNSKYGLSD